MIASSAAPASPPSSVLGRPPGRHAWVGLALLLAACTSGCASAPSEGTELAAGVTARAPGDLLPTGSALPPLKASDHRGEPVDLAALGGMPTVIYFYPKDATPGCTTEACAFRDAWDKYEAAGVRVLGVSADDAASHKAFAAEHSLPFGLIADTSREWAAAFGVATSMGMPQRVTFLVGRDGKVAHVYPKVDPGVHAAEILADVTGLPAAP